MKRIVVMALLGLLVTAGVTSAAKQSDRVEIRAGDLLIVGHGGFRPEELPRKKDAPIEIYGGGKISTVSGDYPPILHKLIFEFDRHGHVETRGLAVCTTQKLQATDVPAARKNCPGAIVGKGRGTAVVLFPEQRPIPVSSPITLFNGPKKNGNDTVIAHAFTTVPVSTTFIVPVEIEKISKGVYGYRTEAEIPKIANGAGVPLSGHIKVNRKWTYKGKRLSFVNARCETGSLRARGEFTFKDASKTILRGTFIRPCKIRD
jgi:hypothetical protein